MVLTSINSVYLLKLVIVYTDGLLPLLLRNLMEDKVMTRKTTKATERPTKRLKSVATISSWAAKWKTSGSARELFMNMIVTKKFSLYKKLALKDVCHSSLRVTRITVLNHNLNTFQEEGIMQILRLRPESVVNFWSNFCTILGEYTIKNVPCVLFRSESKNLLWCLEQKIFSLEFWLNSS